MQNFDNKLNKDMILGSINTFYIELRKTKFKCIWCLSNGNKCGTILNKKSNMQRHIKNVHLQYCPFPCPNEYCSSMFKEKQQLDRHLAAIHIEVCENSYFIKHT